MSVTSQSSEVYWQSFSIEDGDLDLIYNVLMEREMPLTSGEIVRPIIEARLRRLEQEALRAADEAQRVYLPAEAYEEGEVLLFPALDNVTGRVVGVRPGDNPDLGEFDVIQVAFDGDGQQREFAARLAVHKLNQVPEVQAEGELDKPEAIMERFGDLIEQRLMERLSEVEDIVSIAGRWFPKSLLAEVNEGHLNLAEAVLDVAGGGPLPTSALLEHIELPAGMDPLLAEFSLDYALQEDERFDEVGPAGQILWFLRRLEPPEVLFTPPRLEYEPISYDRSVLTDSLLELERQLDDELSQVEAADEAPDEVVLSVLFPHWRVGALPLSSRLAPMFPTAYEAPRIRFILVDAHSGEKFPGWVVRRQRYVFGLDEWYRRYDFPAGGLVRIRRGDDVGEVVVEAVDRRKRNDWIRTISIFEDGRIGFTMLKHPVGAAYDDLMVVGMVDATALDEAWLRGPQRKLPLEHLVVQVFRELAKLNPQSAVHAQALYSGVNVIRRVPPGPIFAELMLRHYYQHVGDLYWRFDESAWRDA